MSSKIEGVPEGWELVRIGVAGFGEKYIDERGAVVTCESYSFLDENYVIVQPPKLDGTPCGTIANESEAN